MINHKRFDVIEKHRKKSHLEVLYYKLESQVLQSLFEVEKLLFSHIKEQMDFLLSP